MLVKTKALVLKSVKYGDSDLIVTCYTLEGLKSYMVRGAFSVRSKKRKAAYFQPLTQLEVSAKHNDKGKLNSFREYKIDHHYRSIPTDVFKQSLVLFLSETLSKALKEQEADVELHAFISQALIWLDQNEHYANFHLLFLLRLSRYLGFYPDTQNSDAPFFSLEEGTFVRHIPLSPHLEGQKLEALKILIGTKFDALKSLKWNGELRNSLLESLLQYYEFHVPGFKQPNSLQIFKEVFNEIA